MAIVTDLDDTLVASNGDPITPMLNLLLDAHQSGERIIVVSGRSLNRLPETIDWLDEYGLEVAQDDIHLSDFPEGPNASQAFKVFKAKKLLDDGIDIKAWYENDADTRGALKDLGIAVVDPASVRALAPSTPGAPVPTGFGIHEDPKTSAPQEMRDNAHDGLKFYAQGLGGDGLTAQTVREARDMVKGIVTNDKWKRIAAWVARHRVDWEGNPKNSDMKNPDWPGAGAVAAYLWGVDPTDKDSADKVIQWAQDALSKVRGEETMTAVRSASGAANLPLADRAAKWDSTAAEARVRAWAGGDNIDWNKYAQAFFWVDDSAKENFTSYKLQFADIVGGKLTAVPRGVFAVAAVLAGSRGGVKIPAGDVAAVKAKVAAYYVQMAKAFGDTSIVPPFKRDMGGMDMGTDMGDDLAECLESLLGDVFTMYVTAHGYHWNVTGSQFAQFHELFEEIYEDVYSSIDPIAENIRKIGEFSPFTLTDLIAVRTIGDVALQSGDGVELAQSLADVNASVLAHLQYAFCEASDANQQGIANFLAERIDMHQKWAWQLAATAGVQAVAEPVEGGEAVPAEPDQGDMTDIVAKLAELFSKGQ